MYGRTSIDSGFDQDSASDWKFKASTYPDRLEYSDVWRRNTLLVSIGEDGAKSTKGFAGTYIPWVASGAGLLSWYIEVGELLRGVCSKPKLGDARSTTWSDPCSCRVLLFLIGSFMGFNGL